MKQLLNNWSRILFCNGNSRDDSRNLIAYEIYSVYPFEIEIFILFICRGQGGVQYQQIAR